MATALYILIDKSGSMSPDMAGEDRFGKAVAHAKAERKTHANTKIWFFGCSLHTNMSIDDARPDDGTAINSCLLQALEEVRSDASAYSSIHFRILTDAKDSAFDPTPHQAVIRSIGQKFQGNGMFFGSGGDAVGSINDVFNVCGGAVFHNPNATAEESINAQRNYLRGAANQRGQTRTLGATTERVISQHEDETERQYDKTTQILNTIEAGSEESANALEEMLRQTTEKTKQVQRMKREVDDFKNQPTPAKGGEIASKLVGGAKDAEEHYSASKELTKKCEEEVKTVEKLEKIVEASGVNWASTREKLIARTQEIAAEMKENDARVMDFLTEQHPQSKELQRDLIELTEKITYALGERSEVKFQMLKSMILSVKGKLLENLRRARENEEAAEAAVKMFTKHIMLLLTAMQEMDDDGFLECIDNLLAEIGIGSSLPSF